MMIGGGFLRRTRVRSTGKLCPLPGTGWRALAAAAGLALAPAAAQAHDPAGCARPALWVVGDADTTIYLFGTFHALDGKSHWFDHAVKTAFDASGELVLETLVPKTSAEVAAALHKHQGLDGPGPIRAAQPSAGLAGARTAMSSARSAGLSADQGADAVLHRKADAAGKPVFGLEPFAAQLAMYDRLPGPAPAPAKPAAAPAVPDPRIAALISDMHNSWKRGDATRIEQVIGSIRVSSPRSYRILFTDRNALWADWIAARLQQPGTVFVAVGTGHLVGQDSVQAKLSAKGIPSARVN